MKELLDREIVDNLPYMGWTSVPVSASARFVLPANDLKWHVIHLKVLTFERIAE